MTGDEGILSGDELDERHEAIQKKLTGERDELKLELTRYHERVCRRLGLEPETTPAYAVTERIQQLWLAQEDEKSVPGFDGPEPTATAYRVYGRLAEALGHRPDQRPSLDQLLENVRLLRRGESVACPTCSYPRRETIGLVCQTCGTDYGGPDPDPDPGHTAATLGGDAADDNPVTWKVGDRVKDGGVWGQLVACEECSGSGQLLKEDREREPVSPKSELDESEPKPPTQLGQALASLADAEFHADQASLGDPGTGAPASQADLARTEALLAIGHALTGLLEARATLTAASFNHGPR